MEQNKLLDKPFKEIFHITDNKHKYLESHLLLKISQLKTFYLVNSKSKTNTQN